jgi:5'-3' exoribonuclease 1
MGIPSYYTYLIKNYNQLVKKINDFDKKVDHFYLDSNSIIYDSLHEIDVGKNIEEKIIKSVCLKIYEYIKQVRPKKSVLISFDGVAPVAKLKQQKERRYRSKMIEDILIDTNVEQKKKLFNRALITPGTPFMNKLDKYVKEFFNNREMFYGLQEIKVSGSSEKGEGEHKIFAKIRQRENKNSEDVHVVYGLDADLIILALNHMSWSQEIYLFRETPEFIKSIKIELDPNEAYLMNISTLMGNIRDMMLDKKNKYIKNVDLMKDYVFLMMFMGNDFMPHFPTLNIRTFGIDMILSIYKKVLGNKKQRIMVDNRIEWRNVRELVKEIASIEEDNFKKEYKIRGRISKRMENNEKYAKIEDKINILPMVDRETEYYIDPYKYYWQNRYYEELFGVERNNFNLDKISMNYLEGLEWNMEYYSTGCKNWSWTYHYHYPPLFQDLIKHIPLWDIDLVENNQKSITEFQQLAYVLPVGSLSCLPEKIYEKVKKYKEKHDNVDVKWAYCKYFWESHLEFISEDFQELCEIVETVQ